MGIAKRPRPTHCHGEAIIPGVDAPPAIKAVIEAAGIDPENPDHYVDVHVEYDAEVWNVDRVGALPYTPHRLEPVDCDWGEDDAEIARVWWDEDAPGIHPHCAHDIEIGGLDDMTMQSLIETALDDARMDIS